MRKFILEVHGQQVLGIYVPQDKNPWGVAATWLLKIGVLKLRGINLQEIS